MRCDIIIAVWDQLDVTKNCIDSILKNTRHPFRLIVVDNGSGGPTADYLSGLADIKGLDLLLITNSSNLGFVRATNQGMAASDAPLVCLMNNDAIVTEGWLEEMASIIASSPDIGVVNPSSNTLGQHPDRDGSIDAYSAGLKRFKGQVQEMYAARGFCMLIKRAVIDKIGFLDQAYGTGYFEETDYSARAHNAGFRIVRAKGAYVYHKEEATFKSLADKQELFRANEIIYNKRWGRPLNLVFITRRNNSAAENTSLIVKLLGLGHKITVFSDRSSALSGSIDHINLRSRAIPAFLFPLGASCVILKKRKKGIDCVVADGEDLYKSLKVFSFIHGLEIIRLDDNMVLAHCNKKSKEGMING